MLAAAAAIDNLNSTMMARASLVAGYLLARTVSATASLADAFLVRAEDVLSTPYVSLLSAEAARAPALLRRQSNTTDGIQLRPDGALNLTAWDTETDAACVAALRAIQRPSNPSGNCICYNLPSLDTASGVFEAELRLYKVSEPRGPWTGIQPAAIKVSVAYNGASASPVTPDALKGQGMTGAAPKQRRGDLESREDHNPQLLQAYMLVGQIDQKEMSDSMSMAALQTFVMPTLTLAATNASGIRVATNVSLNEATFLNGVFSREVVLSDFSAAQAAVDDALAALHNGTAAFVLPGVDLMIFPVGLIITSIWLFLGLVAYGMGTFERIQYAEMYKQRKGFDNSRSRGGKTI
ncbi:hypothetical protein ISF_02958 [Cordyceps fumosorosea ARSEF 2679]|uniref:Uncharacterized protein n=1 Tax=Cordyceps fumosorosea (strain ARSEF 2679) TaxID=1081104 RepID=A0A168B6I2_CORFA|nr:hypothetical protein ISF_02958 [Cordyceps fumosorosea ARSEF 2679]OAA69688.1 hypothetical protein ISF_02958 [Cordyceps fumosorosea ARSEF 2679]